MTARAWTLLLILSLVWGGSFFFIAVAVPEIPPFTLTFCRSAIAAVALLAIIYFRNVALPRDPAIWVGLVVMGALNGLIPHSLIALGQTQIDSGLASILNATTPLFSVVLAPIFGDERWSATRIAGVILGMCGVIVLIGPSALSGLGGHGWAQLAVLGAAFSYACAATWGRRFKALPPMVTAVGQILSTALLALPFSLYFNHPWTLHPSPAAIAAIFGIALLSTAFAYLIFFRVLSEAGATNVSLVTLLIPPSAMLLGVLFLGETLTLRALAAMALIFAGILCVDGRVFRWMRTSARAAGGR
jgi:drug/metabolite transporter (DMT)-like permease